jgi:hypothetical protein
VREFEAAGDSRSLSKGVPRLRDGERRKKFQLSLGVPRLGSSSSS